MCSIPRCCVPAVSIARSPSILPDVKGREEILRVHSKKVKLAEGVDLAVVARGTPGYSGAELANVINEAALLAARRGFERNHAWPNWKKRATKCAGARNAAAWR